MMSPRFPVSASPPTPFCSSSTCCWWPWCIALPTCGRRGWPLAEAPMRELLPRFLPDFLSGLAVNFEIAVCAMMGGLLLGGLLAVARFHNGLATAPAAWLVALMRTVPTFVVMFFLV